MTIKEKVRRIRKDNNWECPYQSVKFIGFRKDGSEDYLLSQMGSGQYTQMTVNYNFNLISNTPQ
jgi:hypothetical protein